MISSVLLLVLGYRLPGLVFWLAKDHAPRGGLKDARHQYLQVLADVLASSVNDDHRAVLEVADALAKLFPVFDNVYEHFFTREYDGFDGVGKLVDVQDGDTI